MTSHQQEQELLDPSTLASKRVVYVGSLSESITSKVLRAAFIPFGNIRSVDIPMDYAQGTKRGFAFVEFDDADDAEEAVFNMDGSELMGKTIRVSLAQANQANKLSSANNEAIWKSDEWYQKYAAGEESKESAAKSQEAVTDAQTLHNL